MSNLSSVDDLTLDQNEIDAIWNNINRSPSDPVAFWISVASLTFAMLGSLSNLMSVIVLVKLSANLATFVYLTGLSLSDMITCISMVMMHNQELIVPSQLSTTTAVFLCYVEIVFGALAAGSRVLSLWISTAVTMDRWILICYPIYGKTFCTIKRANIVRLILFIIAFLYSIPLFFEYEIIRMPSVSQMVHINNDSLLHHRSIENSMLVTKGYSDLAKRKFYRWAYMFFNAIFVYTVPTMTIVFFNFQLIRALHRLKSRAKHLRKKNEVSLVPGKHLRAHHSRYSVTIMVITMVLTLLLCRSPTIVLWILWSFELTIKIFFDKASSSFVRRFHEIANLIAIINAATNFLPFCVFGQLFRAECLTIYCCRRQTSEELAQQARRKHEELQQHLPKNPRTKTGIKRQQPSTMTNDNLQMASSFHSDSNSVCTQSPNQSSIMNQSTNILRLSDPPVCPAGGAPRQSRVSMTTTTPLLVETAGL